MTQPQPVMGQTPPPPPGGQAPNKSKAMWSLILSLASIICCCGFWTAIPGVILGKKELNAIEAGTSDPSNRGMAKAGFIIGIISIILTVISLIITLILLATGTLTELMSGPSYTPPANNYEPFGQILRLMFF